MIWEVAGGIVIGGASLFLLYKYPKRVGLALLVIAVIVGGVFGYFILQEELSIRERAENKALIEAHISYDLKECSKEYPLSIVFLNSSQNTVNEIEFKVSGYYKGFSKAIYQSGYTDGYETDRILEKDSGWGNCWKIPKNITPINLTYPLDKVAWKVDIRRVVFKK